MKAFEWRPDLAVGDDEIDAQHRELFVRVNQLVEATARGEGREAVAVTLDFLENYVVTHFTAEEERMTTRTYPSRLAHVAEHVAFATGVDALRARLAEGGTGGMFALMLQRDVCDWLVRHVSGTDRRFGQFLHTEG